MFSNDRDNHFEYIAVNNESLFSPTKNNILLIIFPVQPWLWWALSLMAWAKCMTHWLVVYHFTENGLSLLIDGALMTSDGRKWCWFPGPSCSCLFIFFFKILFRSFTGKFSLKWNSGLRIYKRYFLSACFYEQMF